MHNDFEINVMIDPADYWFYRNKCLLRLQELFEISEEPYSERADVEKACKECLKLLANEFENESKKITTSQEVMRFLFIYSAMNNEDNECPKDDRSISKRMCKYIFGELTKLAITNSYAYNLDDHFVSRLYHITKLIMEFSQNLSQIYMEEDSCLQLELYKKDFGITTENSEYASQFNKIRLINFSEALIGESIDKYYIVHSTQELENIFGESATEFFDALLQQRVTFVDIDNLDLNDFLDLADKNNMNDGIVFLTQIISKYPSDAFLQGLTLSCANVSLSQSILKPHDISLRSRYRPIITINLDGNLQFITTRTIAMEAIGELTANQIPFGVIPNEWKQNEKMVKYAKESQMAHDKLLENAVERLLRRCDLFFLRNKKSINNINLDKEITDNPMKRVGEIDFIIIDKPRMKVYVCDCKFMKTKYDWFSFPVDKNSFAKEGGYNEKLSYKLKWVESHINDVLKEMKLSLDTCGYSFEGLFITDTFVYYGFSSPFPIIPIKWLQGFFENSKRIPEVLE